MLSISIVTYKSDPVVLVKLLESLKTAISTLPEKIRIDDISVLDNGNQHNIQQEVVQKLLADLPFLKLVTNPGNVGYGKAHNIAIKNSISKYHLILNPDVIIDRYSLLEGIHYLEQNDNVVALSPSATGKFDEPLFLTKKYPSIIDLLLRAIGNQPLNNLFKKRLNKYENREIVENRHAAEVDIISGCFMLCRTEQLIKAGGFDEKYFLYFEDFSLSMELKKIGKLVYLPEMEIVHYGGNASKKGIKHIAYFIQSGIRFFNHYGWKIL